MMRLTAVILGILIACTGAFAHGRNCATANLFHHKQYGRGSLQASAKQAAKTSLTNCQPEAYYSNVLTKKTEHFQVFYTLEGPHATQKAFVDSVAVNLERAYKFHVTEVGMRKPLGHKKSYHYQEEVEDGLYPVEIIDIDLARNPNDLFGDATCRGCFGLTYPPNKSNTDTTALLIDNDFKYINATSKRKSMEGNPQCTYIEASVPLTQQITGDNFSEHWDKAIRITVFHELYHASQLRYLNMYYNYTIWFEASAVGVEEIGNPDVNDYFGYIADTFKKLGEPLNNLDTFAYGISPLYLYLYSNVEKKFDKEIWTNFSKNPNKTVDVQISNYLEKKKMNADSVFHDFAVRLSFSGERSTAVNSKQWVYKDEKDWATINFDETHNWTTVYEHDFIPDTSTFLISYYSGGHPDLTNYKGEASAAIYREGKATIIPIKTTHTADSIFGNMSSADSTVWIFSRLNESDFIKTQTTNNKLKAYPIPWREGSLCFAPLPRDKDYIEIRNRRGAIVMHENYQGTIHCLNEKQVREKMAPGVYWFRAGNCGKAEKFMIIY